MNKRIVTTGIAPLFLKPEENAELADEALMGMGVEITGEKSGGFYPVRTYYNYEGYVPEECLTEPSEYAENWENTPKLTVWAPYLDIQAGPKVQAHVLASCPRGGLLADLSGQSENETPPGWVYVGLPDGRKGYTRSASVKPAVTAVFFGHDAGYAKTGANDGLDKPAAGPEYSPLFGKDHVQGIRRAFVNTAKLYLHTQYRWGGKTPLGIDCSGLTFIAYLLNGYIIYRDAHIKPGFALKEIEFGSMGIGDLIFWKGHVAMYTGGGEYIHSTGYGKSAGVVINSLEPGSSVYREDLAKSVTQIGSVF